jgi:hypothetical protein
MDCSTWEVRINLGTVKNILLIYAACGVLFMALLSMSIIDTDVGNPIINILYIVFIPFAFLYFIVLSISYGIFGPPTGTL